jgi:hypothetical protein
MPQFLAPTWSFNTIYGFIYVALQHFSGHVFAYYYAFPIYPVEPSSKDKGALGCVGEPKFYVSQAVSIRGAGVSIGGAFMPRGFHELNQCQAIIAMKRPVNSP